MVAILIDLVNDIINDLMQYCEMLQYILALKICVGDDIQLLWHQSIAQWENWFTYNHIQL